MFRQLRVTWTTAECSRHIRGSNSMPLRTIVIVRMEAVITALLVKVVMIPGTTTVVVAAVVAVVVATTATIITITRQHCAIRSCETA